MHLLYIISELHKKCVRELRDYQDRRVYREIKS